MLLMVDQTAKASSPLQCASTTSEQIAQLSDHWITALAMGNADAIASLYAPHAVLLPMPEGKPQEGRTAIRSYFEQYLRRHPQEIIIKRSIVLGCNVASEMGIATMRLTGRRKGTRVATRGQFSTLYEYRDGAWLITHHQVPTMVGIRLGANSITMPIQ